MRQVKKVTGDHIGRGEIKILECHLNVKAIGDLSRWGFVFYFDNNNNIVIEPEKQTIRYVEKGSSKPNTDRIFVFHTGRKDAFHVCFETEMVVTRDNCDLGYHECICNGIGLVSLDDIIYLCKDKNYKLVRMVMDETE